MRGAEGLGGTGIQWACGRYEGYAALGNLTANAISLSSMGGA
jgi:hypothetical protein